MSTTVVTALYDVGREAHTGTHTYRKFTDYLSWFPHLLSLNVPMVIYVPQALAEFVQRHRTYPTKIIVREFPELEVTKKYLTKITKVMKMRINDTERPESVIPEYNIITFSKLDFLQEACETNPFASEHFVWLDAGTFRTTPTFDVTAPWPGSGKGFKFLRDKLLLADHALETQAIPSVHEFMSKYSNEIFGYCLVGNRRAINRSWKGFWALVNELLEQNLINNDQQYYHLLYLRNPVNFYLYRTLNHDVGYPMENTMIPHEFARDTRMNMKYSLTNDLMILTVASQEISDDQFERWEYTARYFGYRYKILDRDRPWGGWNGKIKSVYQELLALKTPYVAVVDCTDLFFSGPSSEMMEKFKKTKYSYLVGGEINLYYAKGKYDNEVMESYLRSIAASDQNFPNGGFIIGKTRELRELFRHNLEYEDDQAGYCDVVYEQELPLRIDYQSMIVGNLPSWADHESSVKEYFPYDSLRQRYYNRDSQKYPCALHFPGRNFEAMDEFFNTMFSPLDQTLPVEELLTNENFDVDNSTHLSYWVIIGLIIVILVTLVIFVLFSLNRY